MKLFCNTLSDCWLLVHRNATDFVYWLCILLNLLIFPFFHFQFFVSLNPKWVLGIQLKTRPCVFIHSVKLFFWLESIIQLHLVFIDTKWHLSYFYLLSICLAAFSFLFFFFWLSFPTSLSYFMFSWFLCIEMFKFILNYIYIMQVFSLCLPWELYFTFLTL